MTIKQLFIVLVLIALASPATAQQSGRWALCGAPLLPPVDGNPAERDAPDTPIVATADRSEFSNEPPVYQLIGNAQLQRADQSIRSEQLTYNRDTTRVDATGNVSLLETDLLIAGERASYWLDDDRGRFEEVSEYRINIGHMQGTADAVVREDVMRTRYERLTLSTCNPDAEIWQMSAARASIDNETRQGQAWNTVISLYDVPVFYTPYLRFPVGSERMTGFLAPTLADSTENGLTLALPWYWNIAPNRDATITPIWYADRGALLDGEFRYLEETLEGEISGGYLPSDDIYGDDRWAINQSHRLSIGSSIRGNLNQRRVSDVAFSNDFGDNVDYRASRFLLSDASLSWSDYGFSSSIDAQSWQQVDNRISEFNQPYARVPRIRFGYDPTQDTGLLDYTFNAEITEFDHPDSSRVQGRRIDMTPRLSLPWRTLGYYVEPALAWRYTAYDLTGTEPGADGSPTRSMPVYTVDSGMFFERQANSFAGVYQTLEPRVFFRGAPTEDQEDLPNFDTGGSGISFSRLFRDNAFSGPDRVEDGDRLSVGATTRYLDEGTGEEYLRFSGGQIFYLSDRTTAADGEPERDESEVVLELTLNLPQGFSAEADYRWDPEDSGNTGLRTLLRWQGTHTQVVNVALRQRDVDGERVLDQGELSFATPINAHWRVFGGITQDFIDDEVRQRFFGIQQDGCCYAVRLVQREQIERNPFSSGADLGKEIMLEIELKGLAGFGDSVVGFLRNEIDGYGPNSFGY
ncbi:LPS assembly protein LptD [Spiribacter sp. C176]|uniref:LPS-assembly protein LptD n=1 Tax=Spiribacter salilacus TaxID=2664894 RepID=A0A6N7QQA6_9GAMM|nr:LPS assembly protein LptD [Spiribacter salilacus]MRH78601.1 LPS assembly protein LptD [Spiribacter salilacus]